MCVSSEVTFGEIMVCISWYVMIVFFLMIRRPPRSTLDRSSAASDVYKRQTLTLPLNSEKMAPKTIFVNAFDELFIGPNGDLFLSLIHISEPTRPY